MMRRLARKGAEEMREKALMERRRRLRTARRLPLGSFSFHPAAVLAVGDDGRVSIAYLDFTNGNPGSL